MVNSFRFTIEVTSFTMTKVGEATAFEACEGVAGWTRYHDGALAYPANGDTVYNFDPGTSGNRTDGSDLYFKTAGISTSFQIDSVGLVSNKTACIF